MKFAAEAKDFNPADTLDKREAKKMDRFTQFAAAAAYQVMDDAAFEDGQLNPDDFGVILGCGIGGLTTLEEQHTNLLNRGPDASALFNSYDDFQLGGRPGSHPA